MIDEKIFKLSIKNSHERCKKWGINVDQVYSRKILNEVELQKKIAINRELIVTSASYMEMLTEVTKEHEFFALLTDGEGCILNSIGNEKILSEAFAMKMVPGAFMDEKDMGTNAMSMVIRDRTPIKILGKDHFVKAYHKWGCCAAPIRDENKKIIGVLDLTGYAKHIQSHTLGMVMAAAAAIEDIMMTKQSNRLQDVTNKHIKTIFDQIPVALILSDVDGKIKMCNKKGLHMFGSRENKLKTSEMSELIEDWEEIRKSIYIGESVSQEVNIYALRNSFKCNLTAIPIYNSQEDVIEIVYTFEEIGKNSVKSKKAAQNCRAFYTFDKIIGEDENFLKIVEYAKKISDSKSTILIMGESGTGKEVFAQSIHNYSSRIDGPFVALNCGAIPKQLIEAELFGYEDGAFTGAKKGGNIGNFEMADGGTIFLDEIGEMPIEMQTRLLRVVQEGTITRIGSSKPISVDIRIIAATNRDLKKEVEKGNFRKDLYYRLNVLPIYLPPLRQRKSDILLLAKHFFKSIGKRLNKPDIRIPEQYINNMLSHDWPGNIRELENVIELVINTESIPAHYFREECCDMEPFIELKTECLNLDYVEKQHLIKVLKKYRANITHCSQVLNITRNTLYNKIKKYNIDVTQFL